MELEADVAVVGGGVVGLAVARVLAIAGREVFVLEREPFVGSHTSSRNSEVVHAGLYYPPGSLKARTCVAGRQALYAYCADRGVPHRRLGKIIVATSEAELPVLESIRANAEASGVLDLRSLSAADVWALEPAIRAIGGLLSPSSGIVDSHSLMSALREDAERRGAQVLLRTPVLGGQVDDGRGILLALGGDEPCSIRFRLVVNCAGLWAQAVARSIAGVPPASIPPRHLAKAHYFMLTGACPFRHLVYPVPVPGGLGTHLTLDLAGRARFGPDVAWVDEVDYGFDDSRARGFYDSVRRYYPALADARLEPGYTGIRPKLSGPGEPAADFLLQGPAEHRVPGLIQLYGIESPGLTAVLALAEEVASLAAA
jgi:L-2-hydroxyglutarate oxidase LhgO